jgi:hypothetical protein
MSASEAISSNKIQELDTQALHTHIELALDSSRETLIDMDTEAMPRHPVKRGGNA